MACISKIQIICLLDLNYIKLWLFSLWRKNISASVKDFRVLGLATSGITTDTRSIWVIVIDDKSVFSAWLTKVKCMTCECANNCHVLGTLILELLF